MSERDHLYDQFLTELADLDSFIAGHARDRSRKRGDDLHEEERTLPLGRYDPDVRRLLEGMAYLSARTRMLATSGLRGAVNRLNRGYFDFLLSALPAAGLVRVTPNAELHDALALPAGTELRLVTRERATGMFTTTRDVTVFPLKVSKVELHTFHRRPPQLQIWITRTDAGKQGTRKLLDVPMLSLRVNRDDDYHRSRELLSLLEQSVQKVSICHDPEREDAGSSGIACEHYDFGIPRDTRAPERDEVVHPLAQIRSFFHSPAQALFFNVYLVPLPGADAGAAPSSPPQDWSNTVLCLQLDESWPTELPLDEKAFQLFEVPIVNLRSDDARPILCDGTKEGYLIEGVNPAARGGLSDLAGEAPELHAITGVFQKSDRGLVPLRSALLSDEGDTYELDEQGDDPDHLERRLLLRIKGAFDKPVRVHVKGTWYQPDFDTLSRTHIKIQLQRQSNSAVTLALSGDLEPHRPSVLWNNPLRLLDILALQSKAPLSREELLSLLVLLGADQQSYHADALEQVAEVSTREVPGRGPRADGICYVYDLVLHPFHTEQKGLVDDLKRQIEALLYAWLTGAVEVTVATVKIRPEETPRQLSARGHHR